MFDINVDDAEMFIYDEIGPSWWGLIDDVAVVAGLSEMRGRRVTVRINTPGGSVDTGISIFNALKRHDGGVDTVVDSLAASMGSYLLQAGETRTVTNNSMVMVHDPWTIAFGNAGQLRKDADTLDKYRQRMVPEYANRTGLSADEIEAIMVAETWYTGKEAVEAGFADAMAGEAVEPIVAGLHKIAKHAPASLFGKHKAGDRTPYPFQRESARLRIATRR